MFVNRFITPSAESYCGLLHIYFLSIYVVQLLFILFPFLQLVTLAVFFLPHKKSALSVGENI